MKRATPDQKLVRWREVVGPVFKAIWPLDLEMQTSATTFELVQLLKVSGEAFPEAADIVTPFIRSDDPRQQTSLFSIAEAPDDLYKIAPAKLLDVIAAVVGEGSSGTVYGLDKALSRLRAIDHTLADQRKFQKLLAYTSQY